MIVSTRFNPGETAYRVAMLRKLQHTTCTFCGGEGRIKGKACRWGWIEWYWTVPLAVVMLLLSLWAYVHASNQLWERPHR